MTMKRSMHISNGWHSSRRHHDGFFYLYLGLCVLLLLSACTARFQNIESKSIPVSVFRPGTEDVDIDIAFQRATQRVRDILPRAFFQGMVISGKCSRLPKLEGKLIFIYAQIDQTVLVRQVIRGSASIDTVRGIMDLSFGDVSQYYPSTDQVTFPGGQSIAEMAAIAHRYINEQELFDCDVTITQLDDNSWDVRCGPLGNFVQECRFGIVNGKIYEGVLK